jgi:hypothetical protein
MCTRHRRATPLGGLLRGLVVGAVGTAVMTGYQTLVARLRSSGEREDGPPTWDDAPAPAQVARRVLEGVLGREVPAERIGLLTTVTHWTYGTLWGAWYGLVQERARAPAPAHGALFGAVYGEAVAGAHRAIAAVRGAH